MLKIAEQSISNDTFYEIETIKDGKTLEKHTVHCKSSTVNKDGKVFFLLFSRDYALNKQVFNYINLYMDSLRKSHQTKEKTLVALKLLYSFLSIFNIKLEEMTSNNASMFLSFLSGSSVLGNDITFIFKNRRTASSINDYLSIIRNYVKYLEIKDHPLCSTAGKKRITNALGEMSTVENNFAIKAKEYHRTQVPKHVKLDEFKTMQKFLHDKNDKKLECIIRLMYESGLRAGEVLGLTFEDLKMENKKGIVLYKVILRNRYGNPVDRSPKYLMKVKSRADYESRDYRQKGYGWNEMMISKSLYEMILEYMDEAHSEAQDKHPECWRKALTDSVDSDFTEENNFFIFLNKFGKPLSKKTLEAEVKQLFIDCGVKVNTDGGKYDGLCHRFRHGFAMYQINYNNTPMALLKELMRHNNINSTAVYYTPEDTDIIKVKNNLSKSIYEYIPEFDLNKENM